MLTSSSSHNSTDDNKKSTASDEETEGKFKTHQKVNYEWKVLKLRRFPKEIHTLKIFERNISFRKYP